MTRSLSRAGVALWVLLFSLALPTSAVLAQSEVPIREAFRDADRDGVPDRLGDTVRVAGVVISGARRVNSAAVLVNIQDATGGVALFARDTTQLLALSPGEQVRVLGRVSHYRGADELTPLQVDRVGYAPLPEPRSVRVASLLGEEHAGQLVRVTGRLAAARDKQGRIVAEISDASGTIPVLVSGTHLADPEFTRRLLRGGEAEIVGIASQWDNAPPYSSGYQLAPREPGDFALPYAAPLGGIAIGVLLALLLTLMVLRRRAQQRAAEMERLASELRRSHQALEASERRFRTLIEHGHDVITLLDPDGTIRYQSPSVERVLGYAPEELVGRSALDLTHPEDVPGVVTALREGFEQPGRILSMQYRFLHRSGSWRWLESTGRNALQDPGVQGAIINSRDVTERKETETMLRAYAEELRAMSLTDPLTGLSNRRGFFTLAEHECKLAHRMGRSLALLFLDVDELKRINDTLGHAAGDQALLEVAGVLRRTFRESDVIARVGGDEFVVLAWSDGDDSAEAMIGRLQEDLRAHAARAGLRFGLSVSAGMAEVDVAAPASLGDLLERADARMYAAKRLRHRARAG